MYSIKQWIDRAVQFPRRVTVVENEDHTYTYQKEPGEVYQTGTNYEAQYMNNLEKGVHDAHSAFSTFLQWFLNFRRWLEDRIAAFAAEFSSEVKTVALTNSAHYPFNNSRQTVALSTARNTLNYNVTYEIVSANGSVGDVTITDKQLNGFKLAFDGSATAVSIKVRIQGGMLV